MRNAKGYGGADGDDAESTIGRIVWSCVEVALQFEFCDQRLVSVCILNLVSFSLVHSVVSMVWGLKYR